MIDRREFNSAPVILAFIVILSYGRLFFLHDVFWDDNCWLLSLYGSRGLNEFLNTGFIELRRIPFGTFLYYFLNLHKITGHAFTIWQSINILIQIVTAIFIYLLLKNLFDGKKLLSFCSAVSFVIFPLDYTLPYVAGINYRIGLMLTMISCYLTVRALDKLPPNALLLMGALFLSGFANYVLIEGVIVFELARLFIIAYILNGKGLAKRLITKETLLYWSPFFLVSIPLIIYKLTFKPYGIYSRTYETDFFFFLQWHEHIKIIKMFIFKQWKIILTYIDDINIWSVILSISAAIMSFLVFQKNMILRSNALSVSTAYSLKGLVKNTWISVRAVIFLGIIFLLPPLFLLEFAKREIGLGMNSNHLALLQIGYAIILGCVLYILHNVFSLYSVRLFSLFLAIIIGIGIFFNNANLDMYYNSWKKQMHFWETFTNRFPSLPFGSDFMMDVRDFYYFDSADLDNSYDLEFAMNLLYADSTNPEKFRRYRVFAFEEFKQDMIDRNACEQHGGGKIERLTHFGKEVLDPCNFIIVHYRNGELLVNQEIKGKYPDVPYKAWLDKGFPELPEPVSYPLRHKFKGLDNG